MHDAQARICALQDHLSEWKLYVGKDIAEPGHSLRYFGSWNNDTVQADFNVEELHDFTLRREILSESTDKALVSQKEGDFIRELRSNDPAVGYNCTHRTRGRR